ncbi:hypothetical protein J001_03521 [Cryptococcus neoformans]|nr:hypothetical protein J001_03521 [Cryptococcus neoformans var. grubii]
MRCKGDLGQARTIVTDLEKQERTANGLQTTEDCMEGTLP